MEQFKIGDAVRLKGQIEPLMTVNGIIEKDFGHAKLLTIECVWIEKNKKCTDTFKPETLMKIAP